jgi:NADPH:quinone reductase-like Zn-dependent oxidoreductase
VGKLGAGQKVLVIGASGGVGSFAVQIAKALDAKVTGVCSTAKKDLVLSLGAERVIDYTREDVADGHRYDLIMDTAGNRSLKALRSALAPEGTLVIVGGEAGGRWLGGTDRQLRALVLSPFVRQNLRAFVARTRQEDLLRLKALVEAGEITPVIDRIFPLHEVAEAIRYLEKGLHRGKIVITL